MKTGDKKILIKAANGIQPGEISLQWDSAIKAHYFIIEMKRRQGKLWKIVDIINESYYSLEKLRSNCNYCFRVSVMYKNGRREIILAANIKTQ